MPEQQAPKIELAEGLFEVGRMQPADIVIPIPSVSGRHAMIRVGTVHHFLSCVGLRW